MDTRDFIIAVNKFFYFSQNYEMTELSYQSMFGGVKKAVVPTFIAKVNWTCNLEHMVDKWFSACKRADSTFGYVNAFYAEIDGTNRANFLEWVEENYKMSDTYGISL